MNVTELPGHTVVDGVLIMTEGVIDELTVTVIVFEVAATGDAQAAVEVMMHDTTWPFVRVDVVYVGLLVPTLVPPTIH